MRLASSRFARQTLALSKKNLLLAFRNKGATAAQLCVGSGLLVLMLILKAALVLGASSDSDFQFLATAQTNLEAKFLPCVPSVLTGVCYSFAFASAWGESSRNVTLENEIISRTATLLNISPARNVSGGILDFGPAATAADVDAWILDNPNTTRAVILFENSAQWGQAGAVLRYTMQTNSTVDCATLVFDCTEPMLFAHVPLQTALDAAIIQVLNGTLDSAPPLISVGFTNFPHPDLPAEFDVMQQYGSLFFYVALTFLWVIQLQNMVQEKEDHLLESLRQMGMLSSAYWISWFIVVVVLDTLMVFFIMLFGIICRFDLFVKTDGQLLLTVFWLTAMAFSAMAFFFSTLTKSTSMARVIGVSSFIVFFIAAPLLVSIYFADPNQSYDSVRKIISIIPIISYFNLINILISGSSGSTATGLRWSDVTKNILPPSATNTYVTYWSIQSSMLWLVYSFIIFTTLAIYLDNVVPSEYGRAKSPWYFLTPQYWGFRLGKRKTKQAVVERPQYGSDVDEDVRLEAQRVYDHDFSDQPPAVVVRGLTKTFGWRKKFRAVDGVWYSIPEGQLFALLGHNGSGKSTTFNALTGLTNVTAGDAEIFGKSVRGDMAELHAQMGVCPQHDILFGQLTAREHLELFATIKGFDNVREEAIKRIDQTKLQSAADKSVAGFSGGMRRRLSIAIALLGDPRIVFLDEPTTGMDPVTRAEVLQMISEAKTGRVIVLTSHAMEEVEFLADKVAVMSHGKIQAVGTTSRLKRRFGAGFRLSMIVLTKADVDKVMAYMKQRAPTGTVCTSSVETSLQYQLPRGDNSTLVTFLREFEFTRESLGVSDYSLGQSTLEEVFLNLSHSAEEGMESTTTTKSAPSAGRSSSAQGIARRVTRATQCKALCLKSATFQCRNFWGCCFITTFPVLIMLAMIALQAVIFTPLRLAAVCGPNISQAKCLTAGFNLTCVAAQQEYRPITQVESVAVGLLDFTGGNRGSGVNVNCDATACFDGLEKMDVRNFPTVGAGNVLVTNNQSSSMFDWYTDLLFILGNTSCTDTFSNAFDASKVCTDPLTRTECQANVTQLTIALEYQNALDKTGEGTDACLPDPSGIVTAPPNASLAQLATLKADLQSCLTGHLLQDVLGHCLTLNLSSALAHTNITVLSPGLAENLAMSQLQDPLVNTFRDFLWTTIKNIGSQIPGYSVGLLAWQQANGLDPADFAYSPSLAELCTGPFPLFAFITNTDALSNLCAYATHSDLVRGFANLAYADEHSMDLSFVSSWFGIEYQTEFMLNQSQLLATDKLYLQRFFYSRFSGVNFRKGSLEQGGYDYVIYVNKTADHDMLTANWKEMLAVIESAIVRRHVAAAQDLKVRYKDMPVKFECNRDAWLRGETPNLKCDLVTGFLSYSILDFVAAQLFPFIFLLHAYLIVNLVVHEKENKLRIIMRINGGLRDSIYWFVTYMFFMAQFIVMALFIYITGKIAGINFVNLHDSGVYWVFIISWAQCLVAFSLLLSLFFSSTRSSTAITFLLILIFGLVGINLISSIILDPSSTDANYAPLMWLPPFVMIRVVLWLAIAGGLNDKIAFADLSTFAQGAISKSVGIMWAEWIACLVLVWYLDQTLVGGVGVTKHPLFFLDREYWLGPKAGGGDSTLEEYDLRSIPEPDVELLTSGAPDVQAEYERVVSGEDPKLAVRVVRLHKRFDNGFTAVKSLSLGINKSECFGWLGHNGAGKTTAINMLCGLFAPTSGTALVEGLSIKTQMDIVQTRMGVCPQHDLTWAQLTCREHLLFYARLKGVPSASVASAVDAALVDVNLKKFEHRRAGRLSGGMRRRLSVAMALIGSPSVVYMDEPSTGLDPASKRALWDVIARAKGDKSIVLTTHSMEECEVLCDRLCIQSLGELQAIGTSTELKARYGAGYTLSITTGKRAEAEVVRSFVKSVFPKAVELKQSLGAMRFEVPRQGVLLSSVFETMEAAETRERLDLVDWNLQETTLEEVFLKLADMAHVEEALSNEDPRDKGFRKSMWMTSKGKGADQSEIVAEKV